MLKNLLKRKKIKEDKSSDQWLAIVLIDDMFNEISLENMPNTGKHATLEELKNILQENSYSLKKYPKKNIAIYLAFKNKK